GRRCVGGGAGVETCSFPIVATVPAGLAASVPVKADPSDIDTETAATTVPAAALSGRDAALGVNVTLVGVALTWTEIEPEAVTPFGREGGVAGQGRWCDDVRG